MSPTRGSTKAMTDTQIMIKKYFLVFSVDWKIASSFLPCSSSCCFISGSIANILSHIEIKTPRSKGVRRVSISALSSDGDDKDPVAIGGLYLVAPDDAGHSAKTLVRSCFAFAFFGLWQAHCHSPAGNVGDKKLRIIIALLDPHLIAQAVGLASLAQSDDVLIVHFPHRPVAATILTSHSAIMEAIRGRATHGVCEHFVRIRVSRSNKLDDARRRLWLFLRRSRIFGFGFLSFRFCCFHSFPFVCP